MRSSDMRRSMAASCRATSATEADLKADLLPYLRGAFPKCPVAGKNDTVKITTAAGVIVARPRLRQPSRGTTTRAMASSFAIRPRQPRAIRPLPTTSYNESWLTIS